MWTSTFCIKERLCWFVLYTNNKGVTFYEINFHIEDVTDQSVVCYKLEDVKVVLEKAKDEIEDFYLDKDDYSDEEIYSWLDDFVELINEF